MSCFVMRGCLVLLMAASLSAVESSAPVVPPPATEPLLMGYAKLDDAGLPTSVRVALTRAKFTALWSIAHPDQVVRVPVVELATGAPSWRIAAREEGAALLIAEVRLPIAVLGDVWRQVRLPVPAGAVAGVSVEALSVGGIIPPASSVTWQGDGGVLVLSIAGHTQATVVVRLALPLHLDGGEWSTALPLLPGGGSIEVAVAAGWEPRSSQLAFNAGPALSGPALSGPAGSFTADLPVHGERLDLRLRRLEAVAQREMHVALEQRLKVDLQADRLQWTGDLQVTLQGGTVRELRLTLPKGLVLGSIDSPGLAGWRQSDRTVDLTWSTAVGGLVALHASGVLPRAGADGSAAVAVDCPLAERRAGRLGLSGRGARGQRDERLFAETDVTNATTTATDAAALIRAEPQEGEDLAVQWHDRPSGLRVHWEPVASDLHAQESAAAVIDAQRVRVAVRLALSGRGDVDSLRLRLPPPWRVVQITASGDGAIGHPDASLLGADIERRLLVRSLSTIGAGNGVALILEADRAQLGSSFDLPDLWPIGGPVVERQLWLIGDAGDRRPRLVPAAHLSPASTTQLAQEFAAELPDGSTWRQAFERRAGAPPHIELVAETPHVTVTASHYLVLESDRLRWSARLVFTPQQGELNDLVCQLPAGARLVRSVCRDLGSLHLGSMTTADEGRLTAHLTGPARGPTTLDLDLEMAIGADATLQVHSITTTAGHLLVTQQVALVEDYELGLVRRSVEGLGEQSDLALPLPAGVDATQVKLRWSAQRPDWSLTLRREPLVPAGGLDGIATMIDAYAAIAPDGELRSRATWHVLNRSRQQMRLAVPAGIELWEVRVDGRQVSCRRDATDAAVVWVPVRPLRAGEAARRVELTWRQMPGVGTNSSANASQLHPLMPVFSELKVMQVLWRFAPPAGWSVNRRDGALRAIAATDADGERAKRVVEELSRLRGQGELKDNALLRCNDQLGQLELELNDYLVQMNATGSTQAKEVEGQLNQLRVDVVSNASVYGQRSGGRKALGIGQRIREWSSPASKSSLAILLPTELPWREALSVESHTGLGEGTSPPGRRTAGERTLLGIDLIGDVAVGLTLRGIGGDLTVDLELVRAPDSWWPSIVGALAALGLLTAALILQRRTR